MDVFPPDLILSRLLLSIKSAASRINVLSVKYILVFTYRYILVSSLPLFAYINICSTNSPIPKSKQHVIVKKNYTGPANPKGDFSRCQNMHRGKKKRKRLTRREKGRSKGRIISDFASLHHHHPTTYNGRPYSSTSSCVLCGPCTTVG